jgi:dTDP-4-dehydrorhamnose 3,5-epimerase
MEVALGPDNYALLVVPPRIWNGFQGISDDTAIVANCATEPDDRSEIQRLDPEDGLIPYNWAT